MMSFCSVILIQLYNLEDLAIFGEKSGESETSSFIKINSFFLKDALIKLLLLVSFPFSLLPTFSHKWP